MRGEVSLKEAEAHLMREGVYYMSEKARSMRVELT